MDPGLFRPGVERAILQELWREWSNVNILQLGRALRSPLFELVEGERHLGEWRRQHRTIAFSRRFVLDHPWTVVVEVLKHEMAHQYAHEVLGAADEVAHGPAFRDVCARLGIDTNASGVPTPAGEESEHDRVLRRVTKLLALAESPNANEAQVAAAAAQRLMLKYNIGAVPSSHGFRHLGRPLGRIQESDRLLGMILQSHFFVQGIWVRSFDARAGKHGRVLEILGTPPNLELASYVWDFLQGTAERLWRQHKKAAGIQGDRERQRFLAGVMRGFHEKLTQGAQEAREEGLVWVGDPRLKAYFQERYPRVRHTRYAGNARTEAWEQGRAAGREIVLHKPVGGTTGGSGKLLG